MQLNTMALKVMRQKGGEQKNCNPLLLKEQEQSQRSGCPQQPIRLGALTHSSLILDFCSETHYSRIGMLLSHSISFNCNTIPRPQITLNNSKCHIHVSTESMFCWLYLSVTL